MNLPQTTEDRLRFEVVGLSRRDLSDTWLAALITASFCAAAKRPHYEMMLRVIAQEETRRGGS